MNTTEAAKILGLNIRTIQAHCKNGALNATKIGGRWIITLETPTTPADKIAAAYRALDQQADRPGVGIHLGDIVDMIDLTDTEYRKAIYALIGTPGVYLEPEPKLRSLTPADHAAAIDCGGEAKHTIWIN